MAPRFERPEIVPSDDPEGDQTAGYHADGSPITTDDPDAQGEIKEVLITGRDRRKRIGKELAGVQPVQVRRGEIVVSKKGGKTVARRYVPREHGDSPPVKIDYETARTTIPRADEQRGWGATALHEAHTNLHNSTSTPPTREDRLRVLAQDNGGSFMTNLGEVYVRQVQALNAQSELMEDQGLTTGQNPEDEIPF